MTPWTAARQASLSFTISRSLLKFISIELVMLSNHSRLEDSMDTGAWQATVQGVAKSWLTGKDPDAGKDRRQRDKGAAEDEMIRWHHQLNGNEFEQTLGSSGGQRSLKGYSPWGCNFLVGFCTGQSQPGARRQGSLMPCPFRLANQGQSGEWIWRCPVHAECKEPLGSNFMPIKKVGGRKSSLILHNSLLFPL